MRFHSWFLIYSFIHSWRKKNARVIATSVSDFNEWNDSFNFFFFMNLYYVFYNSSRSVEAVKTSRNNMKCQIKVCLTSTPTSKSLLYYIFMLPLPLMTLIFRLFLFASFLDSKNFIYFLSGRFQFPLILIEKKVPRIINLLKYLSSTHDII